MKVACDFVSGENLNRCAQVTREFRDANGVSKWKEDALQLKSLLWFAWMSYKRQENK